jgi:Ran GTPase-activating protein (RanGAP) involved in mRNA processing and transport
VARAGSISTMPRLTSLILRQLSLSEHGAAALANGLAANSNLVKFDASNCGLFSQGVHAVGLALQHQRNLTLLNLRSNMNMFDDVAGVGATLGPVLARLPGLRALDLANCSLGDEGVRALLPHFAPLTHLTQVCPDSNSVSRACKQDLRPRLYQVNWVAEVADDSLPFGLGIS